MSENLTPRQEKTTADRLLVLFSDVRAGEGHTALLLMTNLFLLLTAYLIIKTVREALILAEGGAVVKSYAAAGQALLLLGILPLYAIVASRVRRIKVINGVIFVCIAVLVIFYFLDRLAIALGVPFFLWVGIFNLFVIAQFWSFANDLCSEDQGKRLFPIVAFGGSLGAIVGPKIVSVLFESLRGSGLMLLAAAILGLYVRIANRIDQRITKIGPLGRAADLPLDKRGTFQLFVRQPYFFLIAGLMIVLNLVNTTGEFILGQKVTEQAKQAAIARSADAVIAARSEPAAQLTEQKKMQDFIARFYGDFFSTVSLLSAMVQVILVSRILKFIGIPASLFVLPIVALGSYALVALVPVLASIRIAKVLENSTDYSLQNTTRQALFLPTSREAKYKAKAAVDTFFVRIGDLLSTGLVILSVQLSLTARALSIINVFLVVVWLYLAAGIGRGYRGLAAAQTGKES